MSAMCPRCHDRGENPACVECERPLPVADAVAQARAELAAADRHWAEGLYGYAREAVDRAKTLLDEPEECLKGGAR